MVDQYMEPRWWDIQPWMEWGLCAEGTAPDLWFPDNNRSLDPGTRFAKAVCTDCPVRSPCLNYALATSQTGIWGGTTDRERRLMRKQAS